MNSDDLRRAINQGRMSGFQIKAVAICVTLNMLDGFDVLVVAFTASSISAEWNLTGAQGAILAPIIAGFLVDAGWTTAHLYAAFALPLIAAVLSVRALRVP
ncbi:MAG: hypothetical protein ACREV5_21445 [Steroidobacter sp.]